MSKRLAASLSVLGLVPTLTWLPVSGVMGSSPVPAPQHLAYEHGSLTWEVAPDGAYYSVGQSSQPSGPFRRLPNKYLSANAALPALEYDTHYYFVVYTVSSGGSVGPASDPLDVYLKPPPKPYKRPPGLILPRSYSRHPECARRGRKH